MDGLYDQFRIALHSVWRLRWLALAVAWAICLVGWLVIALIPNSYEARARIYIQAPDALPSAVGIVPDRRTDITRLTQLLVSNENLERAVRSTDLNLQVASEADLAAQVSALRAAVKVTAQQDDVFEITASSAVSGLSNAQNARTAAAVVQALIDGFVEQNIAGGEAQAGQTLGFLDEELKRREAELRAAEARRVEFETRFMGQLPGEGSISQRIAAARTELANIDQQLIPAQSSLAATRTQLAGTSATVPGASGAGGGAIAQIAALEAQLAQARARGWTDNHPDVTSARAQIARLQPQAEAERRSGVVAGTPNPLYLSLRSMLAEREAQVAALTARKNRIQADLAQLAAKQTSEPEAVAEQERLNSDYQVLKRQYDKLLEDREQIQLRSDVNSRTAALKFRVIERPSVPGVPAKPNRPLFLTLIMVVAVAGGIGAAFAKSQLQLTFPTISRLEEATGLPVLGAVTEVTTAAGRALAQQRLRWFAGASGALGGIYGLLMGIEFWQRSMVV